MSQQETIINIGFPNIDASNIFIDDFFKDILRNYYFWLYDYFL